MLQRFIAWIDSWTDAFNPITVRDLTRLKGWLRGLEGFTVFILAVPVMLVGGHLLVGSHPAFPTPDVEMTAILLAGMVVMMTAYGVLAAAFTPLNWLVKSRREDMLFELVPLTPKQQVHGYLASSCILAVFFISMMLPFLATAALIGPVPWPLFFAPIGIFLLGQVLLLFGLSYLARCNGAFDLILLAVLAYNGIALLELPWLAVIALWVEVFRWPDFQWDSRVGLVTLFGFLPAALLLTGYVSYRLSILHFELRRRPAYKAALFNILVYTALSIVLAGLFFLLVFLFHL